METINFLEGLLLEQPCHWDRKARESIFPGQHIFRGELVDVGQGSISGDRAGDGVDYPHHSHADGKIVSELLSDLRPAIARRKNLDDQIRRNIQEDAGGPSAHTAHARYRGHLRHALCRGCGEHRCQLPRTAPFPGSSPARRPEVRRNIRFNGAMCVSGRCNGHNPPVDQFTWADVANGC